MAVWRRLEHDPTRLLDEILPTQAAAKSKPKQNAGNKVSVHFCPHSAGEPASEWYNCRTDPRAQYEEI